MSSQVIRTFFALFFFSATTQAANIVLVTDFEEATDAPFITYLTTAGHSVTSTNQRYRTLDATKISELNAADLVIVSRNTNSADYANSTAEVAQWDGLTTTVWLASSYLARDSRWNWVTSGGIIGGYYGHITAQNATAGAHPLYAGLTVDGTGFAGESRYSFSTGTELESGSDNLAGTGTVIGVRNRLSYQHIIAAEFSAGGTTGSRNTLAGYRFYFALPVTFADNNVNGLQMIDNSIAYLVPEPSSVAMILLGTVGIALRRRRS